MVPFTARKFRILSTFRKT